MGDHDHGLTELGDRPAQQAEHVGAGPGVKVAGGLVGEDNLRAAGQRAGDRDPLLLAAGQLGRPVPQPVVQTHRAGHRRQPVRVGGPAGDIQRQRDVLRRSQHRQQVVGLEHEPDPVPAQPGQLPFAQARQLGAADPDPAAGHRVKAGHAVHQRGLARPRRPHHRGERAGRDVQADRVQRGDRGRAMPVDPRHIAGPRGQYRGRLPPGRRLDRCWHHVARPLAYRLTGTRLDSSVPYGPSTSLSSTNLSSKVTVSTAGRGYLDRRPDARNRSSQ